MGIFLHNAIFLDCTEQEARSAVIEAAMDESMYLDPAKCSYQAFPNGVSALLNDMCSGYEPLAKELSVQVRRPVMLLYIHDDDYWGYYFYEDGKELDSFSAWPDALEEIPETERQRLKGRADVVAPYFGCRAEDIERYLTFWTEEALDGNAKPAYPDDAYPPGDCWQVTDFMQRLGFPYGWA